MFNFIISVSYVDENVCLLLLKMFLALAVIYRSL